MLNKRSSGILMHISSLPSNGGIGTFGKEAYNFVDFLVETEQTYWQILPLTTTSYGDSPYQSFSAIAGNTNFIDFDLLVEENLLNKKDYENVDFGNNLEKVDYEKIYYNKRPILEKAVTNFLLKKENLLLLENFKKENNWVKDFAEFMAFKEYFNNESLENWSDKKVIKRDEKTLKSYLPKLKDKIAYYEVTQLFFFKQWQQLKKYANKNNIKIIGDMPIYVSKDSVEMWANSELFKLNEEGELEFIAGVPADGFSPTGQLWGNPIYDWEKQKENNFSWWIERLKQNFELYDVVRIDHFKGFSEFWQIPNGSETALTGEWKKGVGIELFNAIEKKLGALPIIAEDLGVIDEKTEQLLAETKFPGMKVVQFAFDGNINNPYLLDNHIKNSVAYIGTHDNETTKSWFENLSDEKKLEVAEYFDNNNRENIVEDIIKVIFESESNIVIITMQDLLNKDNNSRMNTPGTPSDNWQWRMLKEELTEEKKNFLREVTVENKRKKYK